MKKLILLTLCLLVASTAFAGRQPVITRIDDPQIQQVNLGEPSRADCVMGNLNPPMWAQGDWIWGDEGYKYLFYPLDYCQCTGFWPDVIHMMVQVDEFDPMPFVFDVWVDLADAVWDGICWVPGIEDCVSQVYTVTLDGGPGAYDIGIPIYDDCACAFMNYWYFISFHFGTLPSRLDTVTDDFPIGCISYNDYGFGWEDLVTLYGFPGELIMYMDAWCCDPPIAAEKDTWGGVKQLFK